MGQSTLQAVAEYLPGSSSKMEYLTCTSHENPGHVIANQKLRIYFSVTKESFQGILSQLMGSRPLKKGKRKKRKYGNLILWFFINNIDI